MSEAPATILEYILTAVQRVGGKRLQGGADKLIGADHGVTGWDSIELIEELEERFKLDLRPFIDARSTTRKGWFRTRTVFGDATPRELAEHVASLHSRS